MQKRRLRGSRSRVKIEPPSTGIERKTAAPARLRQLKQLAFQSQLPPLVTWRARADFVPSHRCLATRRVSEGQVKV
jgi:hypothetical protein